MGFFSSDKGDSGNPEGEFIESKKESIGMTCKNIIIRENKDEKIRTIKLTDCKMDNPLDGKKIKIKEINII